MNSTTASIIQIFVAIVLLFLPATLLQYLFFGWFIAPTMATTAATIALSGYLVVDAVSEFLPTADPDDADQV